MIFVFDGAATFGWLCVETIKTNVKFPRSSAATFGWLCVETRGYKLREYTPDGSHLRVAVC